MKFIFSTLTINIFTLVILSCCVADDTQIALTPSVHGNFGGDAYCESLFGAGWKMSSGKHLVYFRHGIGGKIWGTFGASGPDNCNNWTSSSSSVTGYVNKWVDDITGFPTYYYETVSQACSYSYPVLCITE